MKAPLNRKVFVIGYGAAGNGTTDDSPAINRAAASCAASGCILYFPPARHFAVGAPIVLLSKTHVLAYGATITAAATFTHGSTTGLTASTTASVFTLFGSQMPAGYNYVKCTVTGSGIGAAILHDLTVQRGPANLQTISA